MDDLRSWLKYKKGYSDAEIEETMFRREHRLEIPEEVEKDLKEYVKVILTKF